MNRTIVITGCSSGIGLDAAKTLSKRGYRVFATARKREDVERLKNMGLESLQLDLDHTESIHHAAETIGEKTNETVYGVFHNGGFGQPGAVEDLRREVIRAQFETNIFGPIELNNLLLPWMRRANEGRIVFNSSVLGFAAMAYRGAYNASKYAMEGFADTLRVELSDTRIRVSTIEPGPIVSKFREHAYEKFKENIVVKGSAHEQKYQKVIARLESREDKLSGTLPERAVTEKLIHALESRRPRPRYYVTRYTYLFGYLKRVLTTRQFDHIMTRVMEGEIK